MAYTVQQLATLAGTSVRTLHFYDKVGLLKPSYVRPNGYRYYENAELLKLQQIMFFRELEFSIKEIKQILSSAGFDSTKVLEDQKKLLEMKKRRLDKIIKTITNQITTMKKKKKVNAEEMYGSFSKEQMEKYKEEAKQRWGHTDAYKQSQERTKDWTAKDYSRVAEEGKKIMVAIALLMDEGPQSEKVQKEIAKYHKHIENFYDCSYEMFRGLGNMYSQDPRFAATYENVKKGLAEFMTRAINYYCDQNKK